MGPLITNGIIDPGWNNYIALLLGMAFGFVLNRRVFPAQESLQECSMDMISLF